MVVGSVQSGKTANYCGLICKAIDSGYKLVVVLAGMHDNLRSQTQYRLDEGVLGRDSQKERRLDQVRSLIGVGKFFGQLLPIHTVTSSLDDGDFLAPRADTGVNCPIRSQASMQRRRVPYVVRDGTGNSVRRRPQADGGREGSTADAARASVRVAALSHPHGNPLDDIAADFPAASEVKPCCPRV